MRLSLHFQNHKHYCSKKAKKNPKIDQNAINAYINPRSQLGALIRQENQQLFPPCTCGHRYTLDQQTFFAETFFVFKEKATCFLQQLEKMILLKNAEVES